MRKLFVLFILLSCTTVFAQKMRVTDERTDINGAKQDVLYVLIPEADKDLVEKEWRRLMKSFDAKVSSKKEIFADNALIKSMSVNTVDVYAVIEETKEGVKLYVGYDLGGIFLNKKMHSSEYSVAEKMIEDFAKNVAIAALEEKISDEEKKLRNVNGKQSDLVKDKDRLKSNIEKWKNDISDAESKIIQNDKDQETTKKEIEVQAGVVNALKEKKSKF
ncbi:MAG: hypothetical protein WCK02_09885 [Bacteroidota bacterium]